MRFLLGYLFFSGIIHVFGAECIDCNNSAEFKTLQVQLKELEKRVAAIENVNKQVKQKVHAEGEKRIKLLTMGLKREKLERIAFASRVEKQLSGLHTGYNETKSLLKNQHETLLARNSSLKNKQIVELHRKFDALGKRMGKCGSESNNWIQRGKKCYYYATIEKVTWYKAQEICRSMQADLVDIESEEENSFLANQVLDQLVCYTNPSEYRGTVAKSRSGVQCQRWDSQFPHKHFYDDFRLFPDRKLSDASNYCRDPNDDHEPNEPWCLTLDDETRFEKCSVPRCTHPKDEKTILWINLNDQTKEGEWKRAIHQEQRPVNYTNWDKKQPDNFEGYEDCAVMWVQPYGKWNDGPCKSHYGFICEKLAFL